MRLTTVSRVGAVAPLDRFVGGLSLGLASAGGLVWLLLAAGGTMGNLGGDGSVRLTYANYCVDAPLECVQLIGEGPWPPGQAVLLAPVLWVGGWFSAAPATVGPLVSAVLYGISALMVRRLGQLVSSEIGALVAVAGFLSLAGAARYATNLYAEIYALPFVLAAAVVYTSDERDDRCRPILLGMLVLLASLIRTEALVFGSVFVALLVVRRRWRDGMIVGALSISYTAVAAAATVGSNRFTYAEIGEWYSFRRGFDALPGIESALRIVGSDPHWLFGIAIVVSVLIVLATRSAPNVVALLIVAATIAIAGGAFLGVIKSTPRYYLWTSALGTVCVGQAWDLLASRARDAGAAVLAGAATAFLVLALLVGAWRQGSDVVDSYEAFRRPSVIELSAWLEDEVDPDDPVFYDFIRFYGAFFKAQRQDAGDVGDDFDYTAFYSGLPGGQAERRRTAEIAANVQIRDHGRKYFFEVCPDHLVVAAGSWLRRVQSENPDILMFEGELRPAVEEATGEVSWSGAEGSFTASVAYRNEEFAVLRVSACSPSTHS